MKYEVKNLMVITAAMLAVGLGCKDSEEQKAKQQNRQQDKEAVERLSSVAGDLAKLPAKDQLTNEPYIKGKFVIVRQDDGRKFYVSNFDTAEIGDVFARTPEEVQTVMLRVCEKTRKGVYRTQENPPRELPAFSTDCNVTLIDRSIPAVIFKKRFEARMTDEAGVTKDTKEVNAYSEHDISDFLKSLPRK